MRALWLEGGQLRLRDDVAPPSPPPGEVLVRVLKAGICNTDLELVRGYYPFTGIPGHEFVGQVASGSQVGARVVGEISAVCHECRACRQGRPTHCSRRTVLGIAGRHGAFAEYLTLPAENLHRVPDSLSDEAAVFTEPLAAALQIQEQVRVRPGDRVAVVGDGKLGLLIARTLVLTGCLLTVVGHHPERVSAGSLAGVTAAGEEDLEPASFDVVVECSGQASGFAVARRALRPRGTLVMKSTYAGALTVDASALVVDEITLVGSRCGPFPPALRLLAQGRVEVESLVHARLDLDDGEEAFALAAKGGALKVLLDLAGT